jgi:hypothetical protein
MSDGTRLLGSSVVIRHFCPDAVPPEHPVAKSVKCRACCPKGAETNMVLKLGVGVRKRRCMR